MHEITARFATPAEIQEWDTHVIANPDGGNLLQSASFAKVKADYGWKPRYIVYEGTVDRDGERQPFASYSLAFEKNIPLLGKLWYFIKGPAVHDADELPALLQANRRLITEQKLGVFAVKIEPEIVADEHAQQVIAGTELVRTADIQPNDYTAILSTEGTEEEVLKSLSSRGRNAVRRATREGCEVKRVELTDENMRAMYALMDTVGQGKVSLLLRPYEYYRDFWRAFENAGQGRLYFTYEDGKPSVGAYVINYGTKGTYKDGGSKPRRKQYGDSHLVQWTAITDLMKEHGISTYDFCGTPPAAKLKNKEHPYYGLGLFKTSFTKNVTDFVGVYDQPISELKYKLWNAGVERLMLRLWVKKHHYSFY